MIGGILALLSAIAFGLNNASVRRGVLTGSVIQALSITVPAGVPVFMIAILFFGDLDKLWYLPSTALLWLSIAGVVHFVFGRYCNYRSTKAIGGNLSGVWRQSNLIFSLVLAVIFLGETFSLVKVIGILCVVAGAVVTSKTPFKVKSVVENTTENAASWSAQPGVIFEPHYFEGYVFALLASAAYGSSPILVKIGLDSLSPEQSILGGLVSYLAATAVIVLLISIPGQWRQVRQISRQSAKWFSLAAVLVGFSQIFRYIALSLAPVSVVAPIQSTSVVFRVLFGWIINREHEVFGFWVVVGAIISMVGVLALTISVDGVLEVLPLSGVIKDIVSFRWP